LTNSLVRASIKQRFSRRPHRSSMRRAASG
jgi:hypothetical protein